MNDATALLYCPNFACQTPNPETQRLCRQCQTPLPRRYLWVAGAELPGYPAGSLISDRYLLKSSRVALDTRPGLPPVSPAEIPEFVLPYLRLFPQRLHLPQPYSLFPIETKPTIPAVLLLESAPLAITSDWLHHQSYPATTTPLEPLLPSLEQSWQQATPLRQLNWLWQMAQLWQPLSQVGVAASLLNPQLLRADGSLLRLLEVTDPGSASLEQLGKLWATWVNSAQPAIAPWLNQLSQQLQQGHLSRPEALTDCLDQALQVLGQNQTCQVQLATRTDQGPSRQRNEDACYPPSGTRLDLTLNPQSADPVLSLVCDGIGGHEGGDIASNLAIQSIQPQLQRLPSRPNQITTHLEQAVCLANDAISQRNDGEQRHERQRMGTTLVMALASAHEMYITHVGDSRVYWITRSGCHQITLDDDLASREVRLGYAFYFDALESSTSGSLVQALGMSHSTNLHPTVQRFLLDEASVFLLCSDGLSDNDRVEECWETEILPILEGRIDVATASQRLIEVANRRNGHDNATVSLLYCQPQSLRPLNSMEIQTLQAQPLADFQESKFSPRSRQQTRLIPAPTVSGRRWLWIAFLVLPLLSVGSALLYWIIWSSNHLSSSTNRSASPAPLTPELSPSVPALPSPTPLPVGTLVQLVQPSSLATQPGVEPQTAPAIPLSPGTVLQIVSKQESVAQGVWLKLKVCAAVTNPAASSSLRPGTTGWLPESDFSTIARPLTTGGAATCPSGAIAPAPATVLPAPTP